jgi:ATP-binding cassette subfamily B protein
MLDRFPSYIQSEAKDCGPSCLKIVARYYGGNVNIEYLRNISETTRGGTSLTGLIKAAEKIGFKAVGIKENFKALKEEVPLPVIVHWDQEHFVVAYKVTEKYIYVSDPELGKVRYSHSEFEKRWIDSQNLTEKNSEGVLLVLKPNSENNKIKDVLIPKKRSQSFLQDHLKKHTNSFIKVSALILFASVLELAFPYLTQQIIDKGVRNEDVHFIYLAAVAYILIFLGYKTAHIIRNWVVIKLSMRFNIELISNFIKKLTLLPISYYDSKITGDIFQRIGDHENLEKFFTSNSVSALFSILNILIFGGLFLWYDITIFMLFIVGTLLHIFWVFLFFGKRKVLDFKYFSIKSKENNKIIELINGMQDIKLNSYEEKKKMEWEDIRTQLYKRDMQSMKVEQFQLDGASILNELKNISIIIFASILVVNDQLTFGTLLAISYVIGHLNSPVEKLVSFLNNIQDVKMSFRRIMEIHNKENEGENKILTRDFSMGDIEFSNVNFSYYGTSRNVLNQISFKIPYNKTTAIVGASGSGKTTLLKLILKFYEINSGSITINNINIEKLDFNTWREKCGVILQESYIFNDTIENNITISQKSNKDKIIEVSKVANIHEFIEELPLGYKTKIGSEGLEISTGQKQRILMARAIYKDPELLLFDEATSALDAKNEKEISKNLESVFKNRTVLLIAHRLSTVRNADNIIVLSNDGRIAEMGTHDELIQNESFYHELIKNQLELS